MTSIDTNKNNSQQNIHPTAIISPKAKIAPDVIIGPYCIIGDNVSIGSGTRLSSHVVIEGKTTIGTNNNIFPFVSIGLVPQDLKFKGEDSAVEIGNNNQIREHVTIHLGTKDGIMKTTIGNNCLLMVGCHIAHDCVVGNNVIMANSATIAGHVELEDGVIIGGLSAVKQFVKIGRGAMIGGMSAVEKDIIPFGLVSGERASLKGLNLVGMKRRQVDRKEIYQAIHFFQELFDEKNLEGLVNHSQSLQQKFSGAIATEIANFILSRKDVGNFCRPKNS